ncbi:hypothetical protein M422DRAFT_260424, partial [Sphaerobolus stellatus SS14]
MNRTDKQLDLFQSSSVFKPLFEPNRGHTSSTSLPARGKTLSGLPAVPEDASASQPDLPGRYASLDPSEGAEDTPTGTPNPSGGGGPGGGDGDGGDGGGPPGGGPPPPGGSPPGGGPP